MVKRREKLRICLVASAGGRLTELLKLADSWQQHEAIYISTAQAIANKLRQRGKTYVVGECNRQYPLRVIKTLCQCTKIIVREHPDVVISTGAAPGVLMCLLRKLLAAKVVWIDSITNVKWVSLSGRMVRYITDLFLVQWPDLVEQYKNVEYVGAVI